MDGLWEQIKGGWNQFAGEARKQWADLTDDDLEYIRGERQKLHGKLQERYGIAKEDAELQITEWENTMRERR